MKTLSQRSGTSPESLDKAEGNQVPVTPAMEQKTILLVEDDPSTLALCSIFLREEGYTVLTACNSQEAIRTCQQYPGPIHLLITDIVLAPARLQLEKKTSQQGDINGVQLMRQVLSFRNGIKAILMSGHSDERIAAFNILKEGIPFLRKPFNIETLAQIIHQTLDSQPE